MAVDLNFRVKNGLVVATTATILGTTASNNTVSGALVVAGGVGIGQDLNVGGRTTVSNNTNTLSTTTGALVVTGGVGIGQDLRVGGTIFANISGTLTGNAATVSTTQRTSTTTHYLTFVDSDNISATAETVYTTSSLTVIPSTGNVGLGTTTPGTRLDVAGNIRLSGTNPVLELNNFGPKIYSTLSNTLSFATGGSISAPTEAMQLNQWGVLSLNGPPSDFAGYTVFQARGVNLSSAVNVYGFLTGNAYNDGSQWRRYTTGPVTQYAFGGDTGDHRWFSASTGTTGTVVSLFTPRLVLDVSGNLLINRLTAQGVTPARLQLTGSALFPANGTVTRTNTAGIYFNENTGGTNFGNGIWFDHGNFLSGIASSRPNPLIHGGTDLRFYTHPSTVTNENDTFERLRIAPEGNIGIGVIPSDTNTSFRAIEIGSLGNGLIGAVGNDITILSANSYVTATNLISAYATTGFASQFRLNSDSSFTWHQSASGLAGNTITFSVPMTLDASGNLGIGVTPTTRLDVAGTTRISGNTSLTTTTNSISTTTGALVITGGVGIGQDLRVGGTIFGNISGGGTTVQTVERTTNASHFLTFVDSNNVSATAESVYTTSSFVINPSTGNIGIGTTTPVTSLDVAGGTRITGITTITNTSSAISTTTGALRVTGGVGIGGNLYVGGEIVANRLTIQFTTVTTTLVETDDIIRTLNTSLSISTTTGALVVAGGAGIGGNLHVGGTIFGNISGGGSTVQTVERTTNTTHFLTFVDSNNTASTAESVYTTSSFTINPSNGEVDILSTVNSTSTTTGALVISGGLGVGRDVWINGSLNATTKSFVINHPTKPGKKLRYGSLEGPENGVYIRGRLKDNNVIELPEYWTKLVDPESITVNLTPIGKHQNLYVESIENNKIIVGNSNLFNKNIDCFYIVFAERQDVDKLSVEF